ncbi:hydantoinase B/oxoprolinase family protein [Amycolatopsis pithecellobii]|uniref:Hydantoinase B/oxoprolinase family protein n=1 Tax=Amycolatopsis pithecellobii TaxID=664692 RepID=A0A6N7YLE2_9PSEU|nr:hydantoinase B/oxoprolinase family protein [Amycolatopsis pithecellobii]MTD53745.1 hydantoinase B/oxoprolinase family protein [Amycolatopsis pithecellobii]
MTAIIPVPGSERYASRPIEPSELRKRISPTLPLHEVDETAASVDPLTYEVIRHRIYSITDEVGDTLKRMSGSPGVTESNDFDFAICDELGQEVQVGLYNTGLAATIDLAIYWILEHRSDNPGIEPGDMFLTNDPWVGPGLHQNDTAIIAPLFWEGELFGWTTSICHLIDVGGAKPGSADLAAQDIFTEASPTPPIKIVRGGKLQADVVDMFTRRSRMPHHVELDLRAQVAANEGSQHRLNQLVGKYGPATVKLVMKKMMADAENRLRARLSSIPDGSWDSFGYLEQSAVGDRGLHKLALKLTKTGDHLTFDFRGTDPSSGMINSAYTGMRGGIALALLPMLCGDIPWSVGGLMRCFDVITDEGTVNNAAFPAAVGWASITSGLATANVVGQCLGRMLDTSPDLQARVQACGTGSHDAVTLAGVDQHGHPSVTLLFDSMAGGFGARTTSDGGDTAGFLHMPMGRAPDVEMQEIIAPYLFLWRREEVDSGGAGQNRGGVSISICIVPHGTSTAMAGAFSVNGKARPESHGLAGAFPGGPTADVIVRNADVQAAFAAGEIPQQISELGGHAEVVQNRVETLIGLNDAIYVHPGGGGGYGDPLLREPSLVASDVLAGKVSATAAFDLYGVVLTADRQSEPAETESRRSQIRFERVGHAPLPRSSTQPSDLEHIDANLGLAGSTVSCLHCGQQLGEYGSDLTASVTHADQRLTANVFGMIVDTSEYVDREIVIRSYYCPGCATQLRVESVPADESPAFR